MPVIPAWAIEAEVGKFETSLDCMRLSYNKTKQSIQAGPDGVRHGPIFKASQEIRDPVSK